MEIKSGIYQWRNLINGKIYIGSTEKFNKRKNSHITAFKRKKHQDRLQNAVNKYGLNNFVFEVLELVPNKSMLIEREQYYLDTLLFASEKDKRFKNFGYNICRIAGATRGLILSETHKLKIKKSLSIFYSENPIGNRKGYIPWNKGIIVGPNKKTSETRKLKFSSGQLKQWNQGKKHSEETKEKIRQKAINRVVSEETKIKIGNTVRGRPVSIETIEKRKATRALRNISYATNKGRKFSDEWRANMRANHKSKKGVKL